MKMGILEENTKTVPFYKLFSFSDSTDVLLMIVGSTGAIVNGVCYPLMTLLFGDLIDALGQNQNNEEIVEIVSKVCLKFVYLTRSSLSSKAILFFFSVIEVACWMITGERQAARIRSLYLKTILRQDIGFFDVETSAGEVVGRMSGDTVRILDAMGEKVGKFIQLIATFFGGFAIVFVKGWLLTLVMLTSIHLLAMSGAAIAIIVGKASSREQAAYTKASTVVEQTLGYSARPKEEIFGGFSLLIPSGATVPLVGESGSGKSTVISLIERFYDPNSGQVLIDGTNLKEFQLKWIRGKIGLVSQEPVLFSSSIMENIGYGKESATVEEIQTAAKLANAAKFINKLPRGLETLVGEHGTQLSGGQKQRIAIARAILKDPRILLLDEATNALDAEFERVVQEALDRVMVNRTTVIVSHLLRTVRNADTIAVIHCGKIVEEGAYSQLIQLQEINKESKRLEIFDGSISSGSSRGNNSRRQDDDSVLVLGLLAGQ
ncbi:unnamed protein product, partial [Arabidopsis halleri]